jgi:hypothetical protein
MHHGYVQLADFKQWIDCMVSAMTHALTRHAHNSCSSAGVLYLIYTTALTGRAWHLSTIVGGSMGTALPRL